MPAREAEAPILCVVGARQKIPAWDRVDRPLLKVNDEPTRA
jgi:hypothetical protein